MRLSVIKFYFWQIENTRSVFSKSVLVQVSIVASLKTSGYK